MKVGIFGSGPVGTTLAKGFVKIGNEVMIGSRDPGKLSDWGRQNPSVALGSLEETATFADLMVLATKGAAAAETLRSVAPESLAGKIMIDATNPLAPDPPDHGVLKLFTTFDESLMERLQKEFPKIRFVKAFNSVGSEVMVGPHFEGSTPTMFICGNDDSAKQVAGTVLEKFGWDFEDMGGVEAARAIEPLCLLWCIPFLLSNQRSHAFKLLKGSHREENAPFPGRQAAE